SAVGSGCRLPRPSGMIIRPARSPMAGRGAASMTACWAPKWVPSSTCTAATMRSQSSGRWSSEKVSQRSLAVVGDDSSTNSCASPQAPTFVWRHRSSQACGDVPPGRGSPAGVGREASAPDVSGPSVGQGTGPADGGGAAGGTGGAGATAAAGTGATAAAGGGAAGATGGGAGLAGGGDAGCASAGGSGSSRSDGRATFRVGAGGGAGAAGVRAGTDAGGSPRSSAAAQAAERQA